MTRFFLSLAAVCVATSALAQNNAVDMGLSVKWADRNLGASTAGEYGEYFAWGEIAPKKDYSMAAYKYWVRGEKPEDIQMTKYVTLEGKENYDGKLYLDAADDAATSILGAQWRTPTQAEWKELIEKCEWKWSEKDGHAGYTVMSPKTGNSIFLPAAGYKFDTLSQDVGKYGYYMSSFMNSMNIDLEAIAMFYNWDYKSYFISRSAGITVRAVTK